MAWLLGGLVFVVAKINFKTGGKIMGQLCDYGNMGMGGMGWGMGFGWLLFALLVAALFMGVKWLATPTQSVATSQQPTPLEIVQSRYARGEIEREEFEQKKRDLSGTA
jgi:putative membrane protein